MTSVKGISSHVNQLKMNASNRPLADVQRTHCADTQQARPVGSRRDSARSSPSETGNIYKIYAESFRGADHLRRILEEAQTIVSDALAAVPEQCKNRASSLRHQQTVREAKK